MISNQVKELLGAELAAQAEEALRGKGENGADVDLVIGNDGSFIPKDTHEMVLAQSRQSEEALKAVAASLKDLGTTGDEKNLAADILKVKDDFTALQENHAAELAALKKATAVKLGLGASVYDPDDIISRIDMDKIEVDSDGVLKSSLDDLIKPIKEAKPYLFKAAESQLKGAVPGQAAGSTGGDEAAAAAVDAMFGLGGEQ